MPSIKREIRRCSAISDIKNGHRMERNYLAQRLRDDINAVLVAACYNFCLILNWLRLLLCLINSVIHILGSENTHHITCRKHIFTTPAIETWSLRKI